MLGSSMSNFEIYQKWNNRNTRPRSEAVANAVTDANHNAAKLVELFRDLQKPHDGSVCLGYLKGVNAIEEIKRAALMRSAGYDQAINLRQKMEEIG